MLLWLQSNVLADVDVIIASLTSSLLVMVVLPQGVFRALRRYFVFLLVGLYMVVYLVGFYID